MKSSEFRFLSSNDSLQGMALSDLTKVESMSRLELRDEVVKLRKQLQAREVEIEILRTRISMYRTMK